jgi:glycosyltransferase involved in cell wall biosynthesis
MIFPARLRISVVVPVRNEADSISQLLDSLCGQTRIPDEIVITDGGSTDKTVEIIQSYNSGPVPVRLFQEDEALPGKGRNVAASNASHDWLAFVDAGIQPKQDWLEELEKRALDGPAVDVVYGSWEPVTDSFFKECAAIAYVQPPGWVDGVNIRPRFIASCLMRRDIWRSVGGFPEDLRSAEDLLFMNEIERLGFHCVYAPRAVVWWNIQPNLPGTFRRFTTYSQHNIRAGLWGQWQRPILLRYLALLCIGLIALMVGAKWVIVPVLLWFAMLIGRSFVAMRRNRRTYPSGIGRNLIRLPILFALLVTLDAAALIGSINWLLKDKLTSNGHAARTKNVA